MSARTIGLFGMTDKYVSGNDVLMGTTILVLGGIGLLLFGMKMMSTGLEIVAGDRLQNVLKKATANRFLAAFVGIIATIAINSSTAVTIITVGFVNSRLINLTQAIGIIMGANVGTTFSAQLIAFEIDIIAPLFIFVGIVMHLFFKKRNIKSIGYVVLGFGILLFSITVMGGPLKEASGHPGFNSILLMFDNPVLALLAGFLITAIIQSSSAATGVLLAILRSDIPISFETSAFIILGINIGTCITTVIASIPASRESKRAALFHMGYSIIGSVVLGTLIVVFPAILDWFQNTWSEAPRQVAMFHTLFNVATLILLLPFVKPIARLLQFIIPVKDEEISKIYEKKFIYLDKVNMLTPTLAAVNAHLEIVRMMTIAKENLALAVESFFERDVEKAQQALENENTIDFLYHGISSKLVIINNMNLSKQNAEKISKMFNIISDIERIGDHAENISEYTLGIVENDLKLSDAATEELKTLSEFVLELMERAIDVYESENSNLLSIVEPLEKKVDELAVKFTDNHIDRLKSDICNPRVGVIFTDLIIDLERSADHAYNIAYTVQTKSEVMEFIEIG